MMDARYYLGNGVAHPFTTGSSVQFRLHCLTCSLHLSSSRLDPFPFFRSCVFVLFTLADSLSVPPRFGDQDLGPRERTSPPAKLSTWRSARRFEFTCGNTRALQQKRTYLASSARIAGMNLHARGWLMQLREDRLVSVDPFGLLRSTIVGDERN